MESIKVISPREREEFFSVGHMPEGVKKGSTEAIRLKRTTLREMAAASGMAWTWDYVEESKTCIGCGKSSLTDFCKSCDELDERLLRKFV